MKNPWYKNRNDICFTENHHVALPTQNTDFQSGTVFTPHQQLKRNNVYIVVKSQAKRER